MDTKAFHNNETAATEDLLSSLIPKSSSSPTFKSSIDFDANFTISEIPEKSVDNSKFKSIRVYDKKKILELFPESFDTNSNTKENSNRSLNLYVDTRGKKEQPTSTVSSWKSLFSTENKNDIVRRDTERRKIEKSPTPNSASADTRKELKHGFIIEHPSFS